jgi:hypothetical protein
LDVDEDKLHLWVAGATRDEGDWIPLPAGFPGSQLHAGATFDVELPEDGLAEATFSFQSESYLDLEDVVQDRG